ncbi:DUF2093 domain-containing protein [Parvularcula sp. LCG005]|uniref:DUF2093 domain-containing protein n=1 Tax=Parvularcula sp. LCG005 TaxID=3078805 RepID=UPI0029436F39|nr:DUF2093 domain-containing protein [Parvularcula sp. LCG005]WOI54729.1 DUF2093 domain-containing protein [Parvularcula sp. LCG005]
MVISSSALGGRQAVLQYLDADFDVVQPGDYVLCAVTGARILLDDLRYWSVDKQEAYCDAAAANTAYNKARENGEAF